MFYETKQTNHTYIKMPSFYLCTADNLFLSISSLPSPLPLAKTTLGIHNKILHLTRKGVPRLARIGWQQFDQVGGVCNHQPLCSR